MPSSFPPAVTLSRLFHIAHATYPFLYPVLAQFLDDIGRGHCLHPLLAHGITEYDQLVRKQDIFQTVELLRQMDDAIAPEEWFMIKRAYFTKEEWCQRSYAEDIEDARLLMMKENPL